MNITQIKETCLYFKDIESAKTFYNDLLGLPLISYVENKHVFFRAGSSVLLCFNPEDSMVKKSPPAHYASGKYHFAFEVKAHEYLQHKREIQEKGITIVDEITWSTGLKSFYFEDPEGHVVEIVPDGVW